MINRSLSSNFCAIIGLFAVLHLGIHPVNSSGPNDIKAWREARERVVALKPYLDLAHPIVQDWLTKQLTPEGRATIYNADTASLTYEIALALQAAAKAGEVKS